MALRTFLLLPFAAALALSACGQTSAGVLPADGGASSADGAVSAATSASSSGTGAAVPCSPACSGGSFCWLGSCATLSRLALGGSKSCALTNAGGLQCWGELVADVNNGDGGNSVIPMGVPDASAGIAQVSLGYEHSCAVTTAGAAVCWGSNQSGCVGVNQMNYYFASPIGVTGLDSGIAAVTAGGAISCALTTAGGVLCWGMNNVGQLGNGGKMDAWVPVPVVGLSSGASAVAAGSDFTCAILSGGAVRCWGANLWGQLGSGTNDQSSVPVPVVGLDSGVLEITLGDWHACARLDSGQVKCWGYNGDHQLGYSGPDSSVPVDIAGLPPDVIAIRSGGHHVCALTASQEVWCWGKNDQDQLGTSSFSLAVPKRVEGLPPAIGIGAGLAHTCALTSTKRAWCWGANESGEVGNGTTVTTPIPSLVEEH